jgi:hypothetical protein
LKLVEGEIHCAEKEEDEKGTRKGREEGEKRRRR